MPTDTFFVDRVEVLPITGGSKYLVYPTRAVGQRGWTPSYETRSSLQASLCQESIALGVRVICRWNKTAWGREVTKVGLADRQVTI